MAKKTIKFSKSGASKLPKNKSVVYKIFENILKKIEMRIELFTG